MLKISWWLMVLVLVIGVIALHEYAEKGIKMPTCYFSFLT